MHLTVMHRRLMWLGLSALVVLAAGALLLVMAHDPGPVPGVDHQFVVPDGTGTTLDAGGSVEILPRDLEVRVGDRIVVFNEDTRTHAVGPWTVRAGDTFRFRFKAVGRYDSHCSLHRGGGRFFIDVLPAVA
jgi:plastocyanin